jgi:tetratricopeptide (TPR) repeat protein
VARSRSAVVAPRHSKKEVDAALARSDFDKALALARLIQERDSNGTEYIRVLSACIDGFLKAGKIKAATATIQTAVRFAQANDTHRGDVAVLLARFGDFSSALNLSDDPRTRLHIADLCVRRNRADGAPAEFQPELAILQQAVQHYEAERDDAARESLQSIGLNSPYLQWKLLIRGLIAYSSGDAARAIENWQRLIPEFLPYRLATPLRSAIDPAFARTLPADQQTDYRRRIDDLASGGLTSLLRELQKLMDRDPTLDRVWTLVRELIPNLKTAKPELVPRLAAVLHRAIVTQGMPVDRKRYLQYFPPPPDDPKLDRVSALASESAHNPTEAIRYWQDYERWLASGPPGWPRDLLARSRALVLHRIGTRIEELKISDEAPAAFRMAFRKLAEGFDAPADFGNPDDYYRRSLQADPDLEAAAYDLFERFAEKQLWTAAERVATERLARHPDDLEMLRNLVEALKRQGKPAERLDAANRALAVNPFDPQCIAGAHAATIALLRDRLIAGDLAGMDRLFAEVGPDLETRRNASIGSLRATLGKLRKRPEEIVAGEALARRDPAHAPAAALLLAVDGLLAKLKPAARKDAEANLKVVFADPKPTPGSVIAMIQAWRTLKEDGFDYRGRTGHGRKIFELAERAADQDGTEQEYETLIQELLLSQQDKIVAKVGAMLCNRFPRSPIFPFALAKAIALKSRSFNAMRRTEVLLATAKRLAKASTNPDHADLVDQIQELERELGFGGTRFASIFGGAFPFGGTDEYDDQDEF